MIDRLIFVFFFFNDTATTEIYTLSLHDALPIFVDDERAGPVLDQARGSSTGCQSLTALDEDRKSTRLNSSHVRISYAVFCLKKKKTQQKILSQQKKKKQQQKK